MRRLLQHLGIPIVLIGVTLLAVPFFLGMQTNRTLITGLSLVIAGFIYFILAAKHLK